MLFSAHFQGRGSEPSLPSGTPHFVLSLTLNEFSILNVSQMDGLLKYGGSADFKLRMANENSNVVWNVTIDSPRLMELVNIFVGERTIKLVQNLDANNLDPNQKIALQAIKSLSQKLEYASKHPLWDPVRLSGAVSREGTNWILRTSTDALRITGEKLNELKGSEGKRIIAEGFTKLAGEYEVTRFADKRENTLELFVMGMCPFSQKAEERLLEFLASTNAAVRPHLEVHYIFYKQTKEEVDGFWSMHGEDEVREDLVQMAVRDAYPQSFQTYLLLRAKNGGTEWKRLLEQTGLRQEDVRDIESRIATQRDDMMRREYEYATGIYSITDGSPTYVWEGERVADLSKLPSFKGLDLTRSETCAH